MVNHQSEFQKNCGLQADLGGMALVVVETESERILLRIYLVTFLPRSRELYVVLYLPDRAKDTLEARVVFCDHSICICNKYV